MLEGKKKKKKEKKNPNTCIFKGQIDRKQNFKL